MMTLPAKLEESVDSAVTLLANRLQTKAVEAKTHRILLVEGWAADATTVHAVATYLVGLLASTIATTLAVRASVEDTQADRLELLSNVELITGTPTKPLTNEQKQDERNPWIAEGIWHLCMFLASRKDGFHPRGRVLAIDQPHVGAKDHGFDVVALYEAQNGELGISIVECKAYEKNPSGAISGAVEFFRTFDGGKHDTRIRQVVAQMRDLLNAEKQRVISPSLWKSHRLYIPNPHYDAAVIMDWENTRPSFRELKFPVAVMPNAVPGFQSFFDSISSEMLLFADMLKNV